jgi:hypothetical protein
MPEPFEDLRFLCFDLSLVELVSLDAPEYVPLDDEPVSRPVVPEPVVLEPLPV